MKIVAIIFLAGLAGFAIYFKSPKTAKTFKTVFTNQNINKSKTKPVPGNVLGTTVDTVRDNVFSIIPPQAVENFIAATTNTVVNNVQSEAKNVASDAVNNILANQLINNFKNLPQPVQEQVKRNICK